MTNDIQQLQSTVNSVLQSVQSPFYFHPDFWITLIVGLVVGGIGIYYAYMAFVEAGEAKKAANAAGKTVKCQTVAIELTELLPKLGTPSDNIQYNLARNLLSDTTQRLHRILSPFENDTQVAGKIAALWKLLSETKEALSLVRPRDQKSETDAPQAVYNAIEGQFAGINDLVSDLVGLFEQKTTKFGDDNATR